MKHTIGAFVVLASSTAVIATAQPALSAAPQAAAAQKPRPRPAPSDNRLSMAGFTIDYPKRDWDQLIGVGSSLVVFSHKSKEATVAIERIQIPVALGPDDIIEDTATFEIEDWRKRRQYATAFSPQMQNFNGEKFILIDFDQPGAQGPEHVRLYTFFRGTTKIRVICTTRQPVFKKYMDTLHRVALSLYTPPQ